MLKLSVFNLLNKNIGVINIQDGVYNLLNKKYLLSEIINWQRSSKRIVRKYLKSKAEVKGTTKKPFPQKGRGMARQGSLKNPHQHGGGVAFSIQNKKYNYKMSKEKRRLALFVAIFTRYSEKSLKIIDSFNLSQKRTSDVSSILTVLKMNNSLIVDFKNNNLQYSVKNIPDSKFIYYKAINVYDILKHSSLIITKRAFLEIVKKRENKIFV